MNILLAGIKIRNGELQNCGKRYPQEVWNLCVRNPRRIRENTAHRPDQCGQYEENIDTRKHSASEPELQRGKCNIEQKIQHKRQCDDPTNFLLRCHHEYGTKGNDDAYVQHRPDGTEHRSGRRPRRFDELLIPCVSLHACIVASHSTSE